MVMRLRHGMKSNSVAAYLRPFLDDIYDFLRFFRSGKSGFAQLYDPSLVLRCRQFTSLSVSM